MPEISTFFPKGNTPINIDGNEKKKQPNDLHITVCVSNWVLRETKLSWLMVGEHLRVVSCCVHKPEERVMISCQISH